jgi:hypothetical protein
VFSGTYQKLTPIFRIIAVDKNSFILVRLAGYVETSVRTCQNMRHHIAEGSSLQNNSRENFDLDMVPEIYNPA